MTNWKAIPTQQPPTLAAISPIKVLVGLCLLTLAQGGLADPPALPAAAATQTPSLPPMSKQARNELKRQLRSFVSNVTGSYEPVPLWRTPVCPVLAGVPRSEGEHVFAHLEGTMRALGMPLGEIGCRPNLQLIASSQPEESIAEMAKTQPEAFGDARHLQSFISKERPVRVWYTTVLGDHTTAEVVSPSIGVGTATPGIDLGTNGGGGGTAVVTSVDPTSPRFEISAYHPLVGVIAVVDLKRVQGFDWNQIAEYVAMAALTRVNLDANFGDAPTILRLFSASSTDRPTGLSDWDKALLTELYRSDPRSRSERLEVSMHMVKDIAP
jgi:hypothetical protein